MDFWIDETSTNSFTSSRSALFYGYYFNTLGAASSNSKSVKPQRVVFIAPQSTITKVQFYLYPAGTQRLPSTAEKGYLSNPETNKNIPIKYIDYTKDNSPLVFRNFLTISTTENFEKEIYINNAFYVTKISQLKGGYLLPYTVIEKNKSVLKESAFKKPSSFYLKVK